MEAKVGKAILKSKPEEMKRRCEQDVLIYTCIYLK